jgi:hypothetical protein
MLKSLLAAAVIAAAAPAAPALAEHGGSSVRLEVGVYEIDHRDYDRRGVSRREAIRIASRYGINRIYSVSFRSGAWQVSGATHRGGRIEVLISGRTGRIIDVDYGRGRRGRGYGHDDDHRDRDWDRDDRRHRDRDWD